MNNPDVTEKLSAPAASTPAHSWPEDFGGENGNYHNECVTCKTLFIGHKRRVVCRECAEEARKRWEAMTEEERQESTARTAREIAEWYAQNDPDEPHAKNL